MYHRYQIQKNGNEKLWEKIMEHRKKINVTGSDITQDIDMMDKEKTVEGMIEK